MTHTRLSSVVIIFLAAVLAGAPGSAQDSVLPEPGSRLRITAPAVARKPIVGTLAEARERDLVLADSLVVADRAGRSFDRNDYIDVCGQCLRAPPLPSKELVASALRLVQNTQGTPLHSPYQSTHKLWGHKLGMGSHDGHICLCPTPCATDQQHMIMPSVIVVTLVGGYLATTLTLWIAHWFAHISWGPLRGFHVEGHHALYPSGQHCLTKRFIFGSGWHDSIYAFLPWLAIETVAIWAILPSGIAILTTAEAVLLIWLFSYVHEQFHLVSSRFVSSAV